MGELQTIDVSGKPIRFLPGADGYREYLADDVLRAFDVRRPIEAIRALSPKAKRTHVQAGEAEAGGRAMILVNEAGLISLLMRGRSKEAVDFQDYATDVLRSVLGTGAYPPLSETGGRRLVDFLRSVILDLSQQVETIQAERAALIMSLGHGSLN